MLGCLTAAAPLTLLSQTAPYVLPYNMTTYAGAHATYTTSAPACGLFSALNAAGDGCLATAMSVGTDPHDVRVDPLGNVFFDDLTTGTVIHRINPFTGVVTIYYGTLTGTKFCAAGGSTDKTGDNCTANDGAANSTATLFTYNSKGNRGIGIGPNGDLVIAGYNDDEVHKIAASNLFTSLLGGSYTVTGTANGAIGTSQFNTPRGAGFDASGNVYVADTGNSSIRLITNGVASNVTPNNTAKTAGVANGPASSANVVSPEDVQVDPYGNIIVADYGNNAVRAIYMGKGPFFNVPSPVVGNMYLIAGTGAAGTTGVYTYPTTVPANGINPTQSGTTVVMAIRKLGISPQGDLYLADSGSNVVWFVDHVTGQVRVIAGEYGQTASTAPPATQLCAAHTDAVGDGCPATFATLYANSDMGTMPDAFGNLYITDAEGAANAAGSRIRKVTSGLNFPAVALAASVTQNVLVHFAVNDGPAAANPVTISGTGSDFTTTFSAASNCVVQNDATQDCLIPITFTPSVAGTDTATLTVASKNNGSSKFVLSGTGTMPAIAFDPGNTALLASAAIKNAQGIVLDGAGNAYIADTGNNRVLFYNAATATTTTFAGGGTGSCVGSTDAFGDGCLATAATLNAPRAVAIDIAGNVYIADTGNSLVRKVSPATGLISLYAGGAATVCAAASDTVGDNCPATQATFKQPAGLVADNLGNLFVADTGNNFIRIVSSSGYASLFAGGTACTTALGATDSQGDGCPALQAAFSGPTGLAFDPTGKNILVADTGNSMVRKIYLGTSIVTSGVNSAGYPLPTSIVVNPVSLVAGNGSAGSTIDSNSVASKSALSSPTGAAVDGAGNVYIADTGNNSVRLVNAATGVISTIVGITSATGGTGTIPSSATTTQTTSPAAVAITPAGTLYVVDSGNNRIFTDARNQITYSFGRTNIGAVSPVVNITELNIGVAAATLPTPLFNQSQPGTQFTLTPAANSNSSIPACATGALAAGAICNLQAQFAPPATDAANSNQTDAFSQPATGAPGTTPPTVTLTGVAAVLTPTTSTVTQSANSQFNAPVTLTGTVTAACNTAAPGCNPTGTLTFSVDGTALAPIALSATATAQTQVSGLSVGNHTVTCSYSGDNFYAASNCAPITVVVAKASTTSTLVATNNNAAQYPTTSCVPDPSAQRTGDTICTATTLSATVVSNTSGTPTGAVTFFAGSTNLGTASTNASGVASLAITYEYDTNGNLVSINGVSQDFTLAPGTYSLTCTYNGSNNYAASNCAGVSFTVKPQAAALALYVVPCPSSSLYPPGTFVAAKGVACSTAKYTNGVPTVSVAQGSTTDATVFITPSNTVSGTLTFACSGLPANSTCTFSPTSIPVAASTAFPTPVSVDVTFWNDLQPGTVPGVRSGSAKLSAIVGWPLTLIGFVAMLAFRRRRSGLRGLTLFASVLLLAGMALTASGCAGPGDYVPNLTPAGTYPVTFTVTGGGITQTTVIDYIVTAPGINGYE